MKLTAEQQTAVESLMTPAARVASKLCPGDEEARSIAYLVLCEAIREYRGDNGCSVKTFCIKSVRSRILNYKKRKKNNPVSLTHSGRLPPVPSVDTAIQGFEISDLLSVLRPSDREIFTRIVFHGETVNCLAIEKGCTPQNISRIMKRCKARLRREIDGEPRSNTSRRL